ncbi:MAG: tetratricopeptide repeat family protein [Ramlibacter sp.]|nr:tetratricopeptide repeat family protein [Ramlibacter sp.]
MFAEILRKLRNSPASQSADTAERWIKSGNAFLGQGNIRKALACYRDAIAANPGNALAHLNAGFALQEMGQHGQARSSLEAALALDPQLTDVHYLLGKSLFAEADFEGAARSFQAALQLNPAFAFAHRDLARAQQSMGRNAEAAQSYEQALACDPAFVADIGIDLAQLLVDTEQWRAALGRLDQIDPVTPRWHMLRGAALHGLGENEKALQVLGEALASNPADLPCLHMRGNVLFGMQRYQAAIEDYERVLAAQPDVVEALSNCGAAWQKLGDRQKAIGLFEKALQLRPDYASASYNLGVCLLELGQCREAIACSDAALALNPRDANLHWNKAVGHLLLGELSLGWPEHEWRWDATALGARSSRPAVAQPPWTGSEPVAGKTILLTAEQGLGDTLQFVRYARLLAQQGAKVLLRVPDAVVPLLRDFAPGCHTVADGQSLPPFDLFCPLLSLPLAFRTGIDSVPAEVPYLRSEPELREAWRERLGERRGPRVGLVWSGNAAHKNDANRSIALRRLLSRLPAHCQLVSLQKELRAGDDAALAEFGVFHAGEQLQSFADTAALIDCMDLVISVDTSVAHLAGALAKPLWLLLPYLPDWRWMMGREDSPWYPTARLFRQSADRQWDGVISRVAQELEQLH